MTPAQLLARDAGPRCWPTASAHGVPQRDGRALLDRRVLLAKRRQREAAARWKPWNMALGRRLMTLRLSAERGIAMAVARWRRR